MNNLKRGLWPFLFFALLLPSSETTAGERIKVVTTIPTLKDFVGQIGGDRVEVVSLLKGGEDLHTFDPRPSSVKAVSNAAILVKIGIGLDEWGDRVAGASGNRKLIIVEASKGVNVLSPPGENPSHARGNPHIWHDPENAKVMVDNIYQALAKASPDNSPYFRANRDAYTTKLTDLGKEMEAALASVKDRRVVTYHPGWAYLLKRLRFQDLFSIEKAEGREPSAKEIAKSIDRIKEEKIRLILGEPEAPRKILNIITKETGAVAVTLAPEIGSLPQAGSYMEMMRHNVGEIVKGLK